MTLFFFSRKHEFFNPCNSEAMALRLTVANTVLGEAIQWLEGDGEVSVRVKEKGVFKKVKVANTVLGEAIQWLEGDGEVSARNVRVVFKM